VKGTEVVTQKREGCHSF